MHIDGMSNLQRPPNLLPRESGMVRNTAGKYFDKRTNSVRQLYDTTELLRAQRPWRTKTPGTDAGYAKVMAARAKRARKNRKRIDDRFAYLTGLYGAKLEREFAAWPG